MSIVVGYLPSPEGLAALEAATRVAQERDTRLVVVNTGKLGNYAHESFASEADLDALRERLSHRGVEHDVRQPVEGRPAADEIVLAASEPDVELVVIGLRRRSPVGKMITGSTAQSVLLDAPCPVLAVKAP